MNKVQDTIGELRHLQDKLPTTIALIEELIQQNQQMHGVLRDENQRLKIEIQKEQEEKEKLRASERARSEELRKQVKGRESERENLVALEAKLAQQQQKCAGLDKQLQDALLEKTEALGRSKIIQEQLDNTESDNANLKRQLSEQREVVDQIKDANATRQAMMQAQNKSLAEQTDKALAARTAEDIKDEQLKLEVMQLRQSMKIMKEILSKSNIDANTKQELESAMATRPGKAEGLKHKIKF